MTLDANFLASVSDAAVNGDWVCGCVDVQGDAVIAINQLVKLNVDAVALQNTLMKWKFIHN